MTHCCVSPMRKFQIPHGDGTLANEKRASVSLPAGTISTEGIDTITNYIYRYGMYSLAQDVARYLLGDQWVTERGNFAKRLRQWAHEKHGTKLGENLLSEVGNIARTHSAGVDLRVAVTRNLNLPARSFVNDDSCWWQPDYRESRCAFKTNGGFGLRSFARGVGGRAWVFPVDGYNRPIFDTLNAAGFVVFNGYGNLEGVTGARVMAHITGMTYQRIGFRVHLDGEEGMQINGYSGYLLTPQGEARPDRLVWSLDHHAERKELTAA